MDGETASIEIDYSIANIHQLCVGWPLVCAGSTPALVHAKVDIERATLRLPAWDSYKVGLVQRYGAAAFKPNADNETLVNIKQWARVTRRLFAILNVEGTF